MARLVHLFHSGGSCLLSRLTVTVLAMLNPRAIAHQHAKRLPYEIGSSSECPLAPRSAANTTKPAAPMPEPNARIFLS
jgi:hypothetical protein